MSNKKSVLKKKVTVNNRTGKNFDIGYRIGEQLVLHTTNLLGLKKQLSDKNAKRAVDYFEKYCPSINEEIKGFMERTGLTPNEFFFYHYSITTPGCSQFASHSLNGETKHPIVMRNYDFDAESEDFCLVHYTNTGANHFIGTSMLLFGIDCGVNEHGLSVSMSACGSPVGPFRKPKVEGLRFWIAIRLILETCSTVQEAKVLLDKLPIGDNVNYLLADKNGDLLLYEIVDGMKEDRAVTKGSPENHLFVTNHPILPFIKKEDPYAKENSINRYKLLEDFAKKNTIVTRDNLFNFFLTPYPNGLCCFYFDDYFGTTKTALLDSADNSIEICWGGRKENGLFKYKVNDTFADEIIEIELTNEPSPRNMFATVALI
ncbi:C45 family autoproteolytic acyltransferase/hydolase [Enterococcus sp. CWB-B31]|uniref:C45 family autoproteolytic acyltransferase/hydolase n=1 Tax=Enterococcus sp. CWB-B31 TaxID=2885159 RepID=UPI001E56F621|nr:C45 family peptidase [Enterococcus sp. CWB-B31]MCB5955317.1 C45 family peptidase [Enterococcus sp. CWB-B31]